MDDISSGDVITGLFSLLLAVVCYLYISNKRATDARLKRLGDEQEKNNKKDEADKKELIAMIEKHYAFKSDITRLELLFTHFEKDLSSIREEAHKGNELLAAVLVELRKS